MLLVRQPRTACERDKPKRFSLHITFALIIEETSCNR